MSTGEVSSVSIEDKLDKLMDARSRFGPALSELLSKVYHIAPTMPTLPKIFYLAEKAVKNEGPKEDPVMEAAWCKLYTAFSILGDSLFAARHRSLARERKSKREKEFSRWRLAVKDCLNSPIPILEQMAATGLISGGICDHFDLRAHEGRIIAENPDLLEHDSAKTKALKMYAIDILTSILCCRTWDGEKFHVKLGREKPSLNPRAENLVEGQGREEKVETPNWLAGSKMNLLKGGFS